MPAFNHRFFVGRAGTACISYFVNTHTYLFLIVCDPLSCSLIVCGGQSVFKQLNEMEIKRMEVVLRVTCSHRTPWYEAHLHSLVLRLSWRYRRGGWSGLRM